MNKRDLKADLKSIQEGRTLFDDPDPSVGTKYELYEVAEHAIERARDAEGALTRFSNSVFAQKARADKAEALARELVEAAGALVDDLEWSDKVYASWPPYVQRVEVLLAKAKEVLGDG